MVPGRGAQGGTRGAEWSARGKEHRLPARAPAGEQPESVAVARAFVQTAR